MTYKIGIVILAAGEGTRLKLECAKPLAPALGRAIVDYPIDAAKRFLQRKDIDGDIVVVTGHDRERVEGYLKNKYGEDLLFAFQKEQKGTADALRTYFNEDKTSKDRDATIVLCADTPLIRESDLSILFNELIEKKLDGVAATFFEEDPAGYGRIVRSEKGFHIVEHKDATEELREIQEVNSGLYVLNTAFALEHLELVSCENKSGEFYLTDLFQDQHKVQPIFFEESFKFIGVNDLTQLEMVEGYLRSEKNSLLRQKGVRFIDSSTAYIDWEVTVEEGTCIAPGVAISGASKIGANCIIGMGTSIENGILEANVEIKPMSCVEDAVVRTGAVVGPFARLRPRADIGEDAKIGNFVEIKKAVLERGAKVSHLSYVGDAQIGENTNIGCGFITCNYDGAKKHKTIIGKNSFIGSDTQMVAPVEVGDECFVASGSTITNSMPKGAFAISRCRQITKENMASKFIRKK